MLSPIFPQDETKLQKWKLNVTDRSLNASSTVVVQLNYKSLVSQLCGRQVV